MGNQRRVMLIAIGVVIGLIIVAIGGFLILSNGKKPEPTPIENTQPVIDDTEIDEEEIKLIKDEYLGYFGKLAIASEDEMVDEGSIMAGIAITRMWQDIDEKYSNSAYNQDAINNLVNNETENVVENSIDNSTSNTIASSNSSGNVITVTGNSDPNNLLNNQIAEVATSTDSTTVNNDLLPKFPDGTTVISRETDIQNAIFETFGQKLTNLQQILEASWSAGSDESYEAYVIKVDDIARSNGIYTAFFTVCQPSESDFIDGTNLYGLQSYEIEATFQKNENPQYSEYQLSSINVDEIKTPLAYHMTYVDNKYGVMDNNGIVILDAKYSKIVMPNSYMGLFACYTEGSTKPIVLNERGIQQFKDYTSATFITSTAGGESYWVEPGVVLVEQDNYYGLIDYDGNTIYDIEYQNIVPLGYEREKLVLTRGGKQALGDISGKTISDFAYTKIGILGIDFDISVINTPTRKENEVYILGQKEDGTYTILEVIDETTQPTPMSTYAREYQMQIGVWQLALLDGVLPVYTKLQQ